MQHLANFMTKSALFFQFTFYYFHYYEAGIPKYKKDNLRGIALTVFPIISFPYIFKSIWN